MNTAGFLFDDIETEFEILLNCLSGDHADGWVRIMKKEGKKLVTHFLFKDIYSKSTINCTLLVFKQLSQKNKLEIPGHCLGSLQNEMSVCLE